VIRDLCWASGSLRGSCWSSRSLRGSCWSSRSHSDVCWSSRSLCDLCWSSRSHSDVCWSSRSLCDRVETPVAPGVIPPLSLVLAPGPEFDSGVNAASDPPQPASSPDSIGHPDSAKFKSGEYAVFEGPESHLVPTRCDVGAIRARTRPAPAQESCWSSRSLRGPRWASRSLRDTCRSSRSLRDRVETPAS